MRTVEEVRTDLQQVYNRVHALFDHWQAGRHQQFMAAMWKVYDLRQELIELTGSREEAQSIVRDVYLSVFRNDDHSMF